MKNEIIIHCSDSPYGNAATIALWHGLPKPKGNGWSGIGYHFVILNGQIDPGYFHDSLNGLIETGRPINETGAHTRGHNDSIGICLIGKSGEFTTQQIQSLKRHVKHIQNIVGKCGIKQHSDYDDKKAYCAGLSCDIMDELRRI